jgi:iron complex outermembrane receptor protein
MKRWIQLGVVAIWLAVPFVAGAQPPAAPGEPLNERSLEELLSVEVASVVGAAKHEQRVTEAPSSVTIVTAADIRTFGWRTMADVLRSVRGFHTTNDRNYSYVGVRGFGRPTDYNNRVLVMVDGHRLNDNIYDAAALGTEGIIDLDLVERIEIIRGPGSALYGTSAFFGVINVVMRRGGSLSGLEGSATAGSFDSFGGRAAFGRSWADGRDVLVSVRAVRSGGNGELYFPDFDTPETFDGRATGMDADRGGSVFLSGRSGGLALQATYGSRNKHVPTASWGTRFGDSRYETTDSRGWIDASYDRTVGTTAVAGRAYVDYMGYDGIYPFDEGEGDLNLDTAQGAWLGGELGASRQVGRHRVATGVEYGFHARQAQRNWDLGGDVYVDDRRQSHQSAVYLQDEIALGRRLTATIGARLDWWSLGPGSLRPRAGLVYRPDESTAIKLLYGEAFRAANVYELFYGDVRSVPNPNLDPELLRTSEVVFEKYVGGRVRFTATGFVTHIEDLIDQEGEDAVGHVNRGSVGASGIEAEMEYRSATGVLARGSIVSQRARDRDASEDLTNAPQHLGTFQLAVPLATRTVTAALDSSFVGERLSRTGQPLDSFWLANSVLSWEPLGTGLRLQGGVYNVFDGQYRHPVGSEFVQDSIGQDGRTFGVKAAVRF